ncbi:MAG: hypothetical protein KKA73_07225 [Chloroflexi bacterium]|nr:hypothetical protein [Chloroflexota bacterium]
MKPKTLFGCQHRRILAVLALRRRLTGVVLMAVLLLVPLSAGAQPTGTEFVIYGDIPRQTWAGSVAYEPVSGRYAVGFLAQEADGGALQPCFIWQGRGIFVPFRLTGSYAGVDSSYPSVACGDGGYCLATWVVGGSTYYRGVGRNEMWDDIKSVDYPPGKASASTIAAAGHDAFVAAWDTIDGDVVLCNIVPSSSSTWRDTLKKPAGCTELAFPQLAYNPYRMGLYNAPIIAVAASCLMEGEVYVQGFKSYGYSSEYLWTFSPAMPTGGEYSPDVATDKYANFLVVWQTDLGGASSRVYGQRFDAEGQAVGSAFAIAPANSPQQSPRLAYNPDDDEFLVVFKQDNDIYGQRLKSDGTRLGEAFAITMADGEQLGPEAAYGRVDNSSRYLVTWTDRRGAIETVWGRWVEPAQPFSLDTDKPQPGQEAAWARARLEGLGYTVLYEPGVMSFPDGDQAAVAIINLMSYDLRLSDASTRRQVTDTWGVLQTAFPSVQYLWVGLTYQSRYVAYYEVAGADFTRYARGESPLESLRIGFGVYDAVAGEWVPGTKNFINKSFQ